MSAIDRPAARSSVPLADHHTGGPRKLFLLAFVALPLLGLLQVNQVGDATSTGYNISRLEVERQDWSAQVRQLEAEVAALTALDRVEREARNRLGLVPAAERIYLEVPVSPPEQQRVPRRYLLPEDNVSTGTDSGGSNWQGLLKLLPFY